MTTKPPKNMYQDRKTSWNPFIGCEFNCIYCKKSFQAQMKRQMPMIDKNGNPRGCQDCYDYKPHFHKERLKQSLPNTSGDEFIWVGSSGDISFAKSSWMEKILLRIEELTNKTFFMQSKDPLFFERYNDILPKNLIIGITLETNRDKGYERISKAPKPTQRAKDFIQVKHPRKFVTIEPILQFVLFRFIDMLVKINPERIYIGYDTKKTHLYEPELDRTLILIEELRNKGYLVKEKLLRERWSE